MTKGKHLAQIWKRVLLRRTHSSCIPVQDGQRIGEKLPRVKATIINYTHGPDELTQYRALENEITGQTELPGAGSAIEKKRRWSLTIHRSLSMATMWLNLPALDQTANLKATNLKKTLEKADYYVDWFIDHHANVDLSQPASYLQELLNGAPKIRALLRKYEKPGGNPFLMPPL